MVDSNSCMKLLDNGWTIQIYRNQMGSYTAVALSSAMQKALDDSTPFVDDDLFDKALFESRYMVEDKTPLKALTSLTEKIVFNRIIQNNKKEFEE